MPRSQGVWRQILGSTIGAAAIDSRTADFLSVGGNFLEAVAHALSAADPVSEILAPQNWPALGRIHTAKR